MTFPSVLDTPAAANTQVAFGTAEPGPLRRAVGGPGPGPRRTGAIVRGGGVPARRGRTGRCACRRDRRTAAAGRRRQASGERRRGPLRWGEAAPARRARGPLPVGAQPAVAGAAAPARGPAADIHERRHPAAGANIRRGHHLNSGVRGGARSRGPAGDARSATTVFSRPPTAAAARRSRAGLRACARSRARCGIWRAQATSRPA